MHTHLDDDSRVILQPIPGEADCKTDYINASYIDVNIIVGFFSHYYDSINITGVLNSKEIHCFSR